MNLFLVPIYLAACYIVNTDGTPHRLLHQLLKATILTRKRNFAKMRRISVLKMTKISQTFPIPPRSSCVTVRQVRSPRAQGTKEILQTEI